MALPDEIEIRHTLRYAIEEAIEKWRDEDVTAEPGILNMYSPDDVKMLARAIRDAVQEKPTMAPDARWAALRATIKQDRDGYYEQACDHSEMAGHDAQEERAFGRVDECDDILAAMDRAEKEG